jgi:hypothetical protein
VLALWQGITRLKPTALPPNLQDLLLQNNPISANASAIAQILVQLSSLRNISINAVEDPSAAVSGHDDDNYEVSWSAPACRVGQPDGPDELASGCAFTLRTHTPSNGGLQISFEVEGQNQTAELKDNHDGTYTGEIPAWMTPSKGRYSFSFHRSFPGHFDHPLDQKVSPITISKWDDRSVCPNGDCFQSVPFLERSCATHGPFAEADSATGATCVCPTGTVRVDGAGGGAGWQCEQPRSDNSHNRPLNKLIREMSVGQSILFALFCLCTVAATLGLAVQTTRLRRLQKQRASSYSGLHESFMNLGGSE